MTNDYWIFFKRKNCYCLVIDIYDSNYMEQPREERFSELKNLLKNDIMDIRRVYIQGEGNGDYLEIKKSLCDIERIVQIHHLIEKSYAWLTPWLDKNPVFDNGILALDETLDNSHVPHYKVISPPKRNHQQDRHEEGAQSPLSSQSISKNETSRTSRTCREICSWFSNCPSCVA